MQNNNTPVFFKLVNTIKNPYFFIAWTMLAILSYCFIDLSLANCIHQAIPHNLKHLATLISYFGEGILYLGIFALLFLVGKFILNNKKFIYNSGFLFLAVAIPGAVCDILKMLLGRSRPDEFFDHHLFGFYFLQTKADMWSFPSGHCTTISGVMMGLSLLFPRYWLWFFSALIIVCTSRILAEAHYLSDVMMGMYLGAIIVIWLYERLQKQNFIKLNFFRQLNRST